MLFCSAVASLFIPLASQQIKEMLAQANFEWAQDVAANARSNLLVNDPTSTLQRVSRTLDGGTPAGHPLFAKDSRGRMPLDWAVMCRRWDVVQV